MNGVIGAVEGFIRANPKVAAAMVALAVALLQALLGIDVGELLNDNLVNIEATDLDGV